MSASTSLDTQGVGAVLPPSGNIPIRRASQLRLAALGAARVSLERARNESQSRSS